MNANTSETETVGVNSIKCTKTLMKDRAEVDDTYDFIRGNQPEITVENSLINALYKTLLWTKNYKKT